MSFFKSFFESPTAARRPAPRTIVPRKVPAVTDHRTTDHRTTDHRTTDHRTTDHRTTDHRTRDEDGLESLFPGCDAHWYSRKWQFPKVVVEPDVVRRMTEATRGACFINGSHHAGARREGFLLADVKDFQESGTVRVVDCIATTGEASGAWRRRDSVERTILRWYAQNVPGVFFAGQWQLASTRSLFHLPQTVAPTFDGLVRGSAGLGVPVAVWLTVASRQSQTRPVVASEMEFHATASLGAFLWQSGKGEVQQVPVTIDWRSGRRFQPLPTKAPWFVRRRARFALEWRWLSTFAGQVNMSLLPEQRVIFTLSDPSWLDRLILVTPSDYPRGEPTVLICSGDDANDQLKPIDLSALGIQWSRESLLVQILYALERQSGPDAGSAAAVRPGGTNGSRRHQHRERKESET